MTANRTKIDVLHGLMPNHLHTRNNTNWNALIEAIGGEDEATSQLVAEVRRQFFIKTANRPYLDRLGANNGVSRPSLVGMDDQTFKKYVPVLSYQPKQVKLIIDQLLDLFFFKESTTAFITAQIPAPYVFSDDWELEYLVDETNSERIAITANDVTDLDDVSVDEIVAVINRQAKHSYATSYYDSIDKNFYVRLFTTTVGSKGSIRIVGGRINIPLQFNGFIGAAGNGVTTQWLVDKVGDDATFQHIGGDVPGFNQLQVGDVFIVSGIEDNIGSFPITALDLATSTLTVKNLFAEPGTYTQTSDRDTKFLRPNKYVCYFTSQRAVTWETSPGEIIVEMPTSPPVVRRVLKGSAHMNGPVTLMASRDSSSSMTLDDATNFPTSGTFFLEAVNEIKTRILTPLDDYVVTQTLNTRLIGRPVKYTYTDRVSVDTTGDTTLGSTQITNVVSTTGIVAKQEISMAGVPPYAQVVSIVGDIVNISHPATVTAEDESVSFLTNQLTGISPNLPALATLSAVGLASSGSKVILVSAVSSDVSSMSGPYIWDKSAAFVLSSLSGTIAQELQAGRSVKLLALGTNDLPTESGYVILDFGQTTQEGPIRYLFKPTGTTMALDPSYAFLFNHDSGASITLINQKGPHPISTSGDEYAPYITDPTAAREILEELIRSVKSAGIFVNFLVRYPEQFYATIDCYRSGIDPG